jgi:hypothetical protein
MKHWMIFLCLTLSLTHASGQYFHETFELQYNLRPTLKDQQKMKSEVMTWSFLKFKNTVPNFLDNFRVDSRFGFPKTQSDFFGNAEFGLSLQAVIPGKYNKLTTCGRPPMNIRLYDGYGSSNAFIPGIQYLKTWKPANQSDWDIRFGIGGRYNLVGNNYYHDSIFPLGFDASFIWRIKVFTIQVMQSYNSFYSAYRYQSEELTDEIDTEANKITIPDENYDMSLVTLSFGDPYWKYADDKERLVYNLYFTAQNMYPTKENAFKEFSLKNLDYILGFRINFHGFTINPEYTYRYSIQIDNISYEGQYFSLMAGYIINAFEVKMGFCTGIYYPLAVDLNSLQNINNLYLEKRIISIGYNL